MKVLLAVHGYPPELVGGTESSVRSLAHGLAREGLQVAVVAGSMRWQEGFRVSEETDREPTTGRSIPVHRIHRDDLYFDHWHKSSSPRAVTAFREILRRERPDVVHVNHWIRLSRDLVAAAAAEGVPAVVSLHDLWATCLITFRVPPGERDLCRAGLGPDPCLACAARTLPHTPWVGAEEAARLFEEHRADVVRELRLARTVAVPSRAHAEAVRTWLDLGGSELRVRVVPPGRDPPVARRAPLEPPGRDVLRLSSWGFLNAVKGTDLVLRAMRRLRTPERVELHLLGEAVEPSYGRELRALASGLAVTFHGAYGGPEHLATHPGTAAHAMVSGTRAHESWGLVLDEALWLGMPVLLPDAGAFAERARGAPWALVYRQGDERSLAAAIERLLSEPGLVASLTASLPPPASVCPSARDHALAWIELYREASVAGAPPPPAEADFHATERRSFEQAWDRTLSDASAEELGFEGGGGT